MDEEGAPLSEGVQVVDPDVRAHVYSLVTALGGFNGESADRYVLGDDALACLRDIKRWLKLYDEKHNRMDVARCLGEANLVNGDLLPILTLWSTSGQKSKHMSRIALACRK
ncbi:Topoisomerase 1-associated factor 1 [Aspergillus fumigatus]